MDFERLASEWLRALRGRRSQPAFSRRLRYKSNIAYLWESGRAYPRFSRALSAARVAGVEPVLALRAFYGPNRQPSWLDDDATDPLVLSTALLDDLRGGLRVGELARRTGFSRFAVSRWLDGQTEPRLPQALALIEAASLRVLDLVAAFVDPARLPSFAARHAELLAARRAAYEQPFSQVVLRALELEPVVGLAHHRPGAIAERVGITEAEEAAYLAALLATGQVRRVGERYEPTRVQAVDTRGDARRSEALKRFFAQLAVARLGEGAPMASGYNVFAVSQADYERIVALQRSYFTQLRAIVAASEPAQVVGLASTQVLPLSREP